ncbi:hypothetical protein KZ820_13745 [Sphingomonas sp. RRHST34]|uniref:Uncharacterized protein n=1 Tax=Sphingomonas citri TaxID=2862499 RepID=A0ABS7BQF0_9SPHN|nr:hypothetical protein [Sphingomonas citri]MBW6531801.1 hypothetical protein [Sphingomonas citri]
MDHLSRDRRRAVARDREGLTAEALHLVLGEKAVRVLVHSAKARSDHALAHLGSIRRFDLPLRLGIACDHRIDSAVKLGGKLVIFISRPERGSGLAA